MAVRNTTGATAQQFGRNPAEAKPVEDRSDSIDGEAIERIESRLDEGGANDSFPPYTEPPIDIGPQPIERR